MTDAVICGYAHLMRRCAADLGEADLAFFDPDNGLEVSIAKGRKNSSKYVYLDEVAEFYGSGKSLLLYQHFPRIERTAFMASCAERLRGVASGAAIWAFSTAHVVFFLLVHPHSPARLAVAAMEACGRWAPGFVGGEYLGRDNDMKLAGYPSPSHIM